MSKIKKNIHLLQEMGAKLANFRVKLGFALGQKKLNQDVFGEMFGGYSLRSISAYESGDSEVPGPLLYAIWQAGGSVDGIFGYGEIGEQAAMKLAECFRLAMKRRDKIDDLKWNAIERAMKEAGYDGKNAQETEATIGETSTRQKKGYPTTRKISRRR